MKILSLLLISLFVVNSCTDAKRTKMNSFGDKFKVELINCDGSTTHSWISTGKVLRNNNSNGYYFKDEKTGNLTEVSGTIIISKL